MVTVTERSPDEVLRSVEKHRVELLPTSPTFINLILLSEAYKRYDLSALKLVTYGTEPMPQQTIDRFNELFPDIEMRQTYGLSEVGILQSKSKSSNSLWMKIGGTGFQTRVVNDILHIKSETAMLGYLNYPDPFTPDGWFVTGDKVLQDGDYVRILGRDSEIINVGGEKVYPVEVESAAMAMPNVADVLVYGCPNAIMGEIVCADVRLVEPEEKNSFVPRLKAHCRACLKAFMVPVKVRLVSAPSYSERFKKIRSKNA
jgi:acyl-coenzyme A synthetase/AMP-(fatty) acid ligase